VSPTLPLVAAPEGPAGSAPAEPVASLPRAGLRPA